MSKRIILLAVLLSIIPYFLSAQKDLWKPIKESSIPEVGKRYIFPKKYTTLKLDLAAMRTALAKAPMTQTDAVKNSPAFLEIPWPDGTTKTFQIIESPIMEQGLMDKFPEIKTYAGSEVGDEGKYIRLDLTPQGFHAMILTAGEGTIYIDPYSFGGGDIDHYICYNKRDFAPIAGKTMVCDVAGNPVNVDDFRPSSNTAARYGSCEKRTYRLALAATAEYTAFQGGTVALAQAAQVTTMNRVNGLYLKDMAIQMNIIANNNLLIYTNSGSDPYTNGNAGSMITQNQNNVTTVIGSANYDIGHVFGTNSGGLAGLGVVCSSSSKARGVTGSSAPVGDPFDIDYVAHEMGHQFDCNHTFNNSCGGNRNNATAMEPGSGSTIMAYAGICAPDVQSNSDDYFHAISLEEMGAFITSGSHTCPVKTPLSNSAPTITSATTTNLTLPISTPFALTATATDPNSTNVLTYCWEQMDNATATMSPVSTSTVGPSFRSLTPSTNGTRYFPNLAAINAGGPFTWEVLPSVSRSMNFRVSVRDNAPGGSCSDHENITVNFTNTAGPFIVNYPSATGISWPGASNQTVTWSVANTNVAPVACANVNILLSTDGGLTYPTVLATNVPNNGSYSVLVPNTATTTARIMVICANGTFFDVSNNNFTITTAINDYTLSTTSSSATACQPANATYTVSIGRVGTYSNPVTLSVTGVPAGATATFGTNPVATPGSTTLTISNTGSAAPGTYSLSLIGNSASGTKNTPLTLYITGIPSATTLTAPVNMATGVNVPTTFTWAAGSAGAVYSIDISTNAAFSAIVDNATNLATPTYVSSVLSMGSTYYWRVRASNSCGTGTYSSTFSFTTSNCGVYASTDVPKTISTSGTPTITSVLTVPLTGTITDVDVINVTGTHTYIEDLTFSLTSPATTTRDLLVEICGSQDNFDINWDDAGLPYTSIPCPPTDGNTYQPQSTLAAFNGETSNGVWTLTVADGANQDGGQLQSWSLRVCTVPPCSINGTPTNIACNGAATGSITTTPTGSPTYSYAWSNGRTTANNTGLTAGIYTVTMTDGNTCVATTSVTITQPAALVTSISPTTNVLCRGAATGAATATATGGTGTKTYLWSNGRTTAANTGLIAGTYTVTVTDANSCKASASTTITQPTSVVAASISSTINVLCRGAATGATTANGTGGTGTKTYLWSNGRTTAANTGLVAGTYTVTVTDANGCKASTSATITQPASAVATSIGSVVNVLCNGATTGSMTASGTGGTGTKTYLWSNGRTTAANTGLAAGSYTVTVKDANNCTVTASATITQPTAITASMSSAPMTCAGNDGSATVAATGGTGSKTYLWSNGRTTASNTGLNNGTYSVTVTDASGCTVANSVSVADGCNCIMTANIVTNNQVSCNGGSNGQATASSSNGTGAISYLWSNGATTATNAGLTAGSYTVTTTDANGCTASASTTITQPASAVAVAISSTTNVLCRGAATGSTTANSTGGTGTKTYLWSNGRTTAANTGLVAGTYTVTVTDANGCKSSASATITQPASAVAASISSTTNVDCNAAATGSTTANGTGGTGTKTYLWSNGVTTANNTGLIAGTYSVTTTDANGCFSSTSVVITEPAVLNGSINDNADGTALASATGGTPSYTYQWGASAGNQTTATATGLVHNNTYNVTITDANGCITTANVTVNIVGLDDIQNLSLFDVVPNPNTGAFQIRVTFSKAQESSIRLTNVLGQVLQEYHFSDAAFNIPVDLQQQASGVYFVLLQTSNKATTRKVIISK